MVRKLASIATRHVAGRGIASQLLMLSERWRATTLTAAPVRPPDDSDVARDLSALRDVTARISEAQASGTAIPSLEREQSRLEASVRQRMLRTSGAGGSATRARLDVAQRKTKFGDTTLLELVEVDDVLHVVTVDNQRTKMHTVGPTETAMSELEFARSVCVGSRRPPARPWSGRRPARCPARPARSRERCWDRPSMPSAMGPW
jgi:hypothetical protein